MLLLGKIVAQIKAVLHHDLRCIDRKTIIKNNRILLAKEVTDAGIAHA